MRYTTSNYHADLNNSPPINFLLIPMAALINPFLSNAEKILFGYFDDLSWKIHIDNKQLKHIVNLKNEAEVEYCIKQLEAAGYINISYINEKMYIQSVKNLNTYYNKILIYYNDIMENYCGATIDEFYGNIYDLFYVTMKEYCPNFNFSGREKETNQCK